VKKWCTKIGCHLHRERDGRHSSEVPSQ
jgi:hypothetical protein